MSTPLAMIIIVLAILTIEVAVNIPDWTLMKVSLLSTSAQTHVASGQWLRGRPGFVELLEQTTRPLCESDAYVLAAGADFELEPNLALGLHTLLATHVYPAGERAASVVALPPMH